MKQREKKIEYRNEIDHLGSIPIPKHALWGAQTARALKNFKISGKKVDPLLIQTYLTLKEAAATANFASGALSKKKAQLICRATRILKRLSPANQSALFPLDIYQAGAGTSINMNVNEVIANTANSLLGKPPGTYQPIHPNDDVNQSQSTNDTFPTVMRLALLEASRTLVDSLESLADAFETKGKAWQRIPKAARTHLQDAVPIRLGEEFLAYSATIRRSHQWLMECREDLRELGIGGSAAGTALNVPPRYIDFIIPTLQKLTGEKLKSSANLYEAMQSQALISRYSSTLKVTALEMTRICNDLRLLASGPNTGFAEIILPAVQAGSSIMPGKINPSILEMCNQVWFSVLGGDLTVSYSVQAGQLELNVMMPIIAFTLLESTRIATQSNLTLKELCIDGLMPNLPQLRHHFESTPQIATILSPKLGYAATAALVKEATAQGTTILELVRKKKLLSEEEVHSLFDTERLTGVPSTARRRLG